MSITCTLLSCHRCLLTCWSRYYGHSHQNLKCMTSKQRSAPSTVRMSVLLCNIFCVDFVSWYMAAVRLVGWFTTPRTSTQHRDRLAVIPRQSRFVSGPPPFFFFSFVVVVVGSRHSRRGMKSRWVLYILHRHMYVCKQLFLTRGGEKLITSIRGERACSFSFLFLHRPFP